MDVYYEWAQLINNRDMGNGQSGSAGLQAEKWDSEDWLVLQERSTYQLWQENRTGRRYMAFTVNEAATTQSQLQLYGFRLLNNAHLVAVQRLLNHQAMFLCAEPNQRWALVEHLPLDATSFRRALSMQQGLTVLQGCLNGYHALNYIYGPLLASPEHIHFTEQGVTKVWIHPNLANNLPSQPTESREAHQCIQRLFQVVEELITNGYSSFRMEAVNASTFEEAEQILESYTRRHGLKLSDHIALEKCNLDEPVKYQAQSSQVQLNVRVQPEQRLHEPQQHQYYHQVAGNRANLRQQHDHHKEKSLTRLETIVEHSKIHSRVLLTPEPPVEVIKTEHVIRRHPIVSQTKPQKHTIVIPPPNPTSKVVGQREPVRVSHPPSPAINNRPHSHLIIVIPRPHQAQLPQTRQVVAQQQQLSQHHQITQLAQVQTVEQIRLTHKEQQQHEQNEEDREEQVIIEPPPHLPSQQEPQPSTVVQITQQTQVHHVEKHQSEIEGPQVELVESLSADQSSSLKLFNNSSAVSVPYQISNSSGPTVTQPQTHLAPHPQTVPEESMSPQPSPRAEGQQQPSAQLLPQLPQVEPEIDLPPPELPPELPPTSIIINTGRERGESKAGESVAEESITETPRPLDDIQRWEESLVLMQERQQSRKSTPGHQSTPVATPPPLPEPQEQQVEAQPEEDANQDYTAAESNAALTTAVYENSQPSISVPLVTIQEESPSFVRLSKKTISSSKKVSFQEPSKYTFGKIELEPSQASQQYFKAQSRYNHSNKSISFGDQYGETKRRRKISDRERSSRYDSMQERYLKYVLNREQRNQMSSREMSSIPINEETLQQVSRRDYMFTQGTINQNDTSGLSQSISQRTRRKANTLSFEDRIKEEEEEEMGKVLGRSRHRQRLTYDHLRQILRH